MLDVRLSLWRRRIPDEMQRRRGRQERARRGGRMTRTFPENQAWCCPPFCQHDSLCPNAPDAPEEEEE